MNFAVIASDPEHDALQVHFTVNDSLVMQNSKQFQYSPHRWVKRVRVTVSDGEKQ